MLSSRSRLSTSRSALGLAAACCAPLVFANWAPAQSLQIVYRDGDVIPAGVAGTGPLYQVLDFRINDHGATLACLNDGERMYVIRNGVAVGIGGDWISSVHTPGSPQFGWSFDRLSFDNAGTYVWTSTLVGPPPSADSGVFRNGVLIVQKGANSTAPQYAGPAPYVGLGRALTDGANGLLLYAQVDDPSVAGAGEPALIRCTVDASGALQTESVVVKKGDTPAGMPGQTVTQIGAYAFNGLGQALCVVSGPDHSTALMLDSVVLVRPGDPSPLPGFTWKQMWRVALNDRGDYACSGTVQSGATVLNVICVNNTTLAVRGDAGFAATGGTFGSVAIDTLALDHEGNVYWQGRWAGTQPGSNEEGVFRNDQLVVQTRVTPLGGSYAQSFLSSYYSPSVSDNGRFFTFSCRLENYVDVGVLVDFRAPSPGVEPFCFGDGTFTDHATPCPCGNDGVAGNGCGHSFDPEGAYLTAQGSPATYDVVLRSAREPVASFTLFLQHDAPGDTVFHDGVLCAGGNLVRLRGRPAIAGEVFFPDASFARDATTTLFQRGGVTPGSGAVRYYSAWYRNASSSFCPPARANVTNGLRVTW